MSTVNLDDGGVNESDGQIHIGRAYPKHRVLDADVLDEAVADQIGNKAGVTSTG